MTILSSYTAVVERNQVWSGAFASEPYEAAWAREAIFFVRALDSGLAGAEVEARVQISPDGTRWCDEGTRFLLPTAADGVTFGRVSHFGGWLRIAGDVPDGAAVTVIVYLALKA